MSCMLPHQLTISNGILSHAQYIHSPNFNQRPDNSVIDLIVIHNISLPAGVFGEDYIIKFFQNKLDHTLDPSFISIRNLKVSSHLLIRRDGSIIQFVPFHQRAWHAGYSSFNSVDNCNDYAIGIELEGCDFLPFEDCQYTHLAIIIKTLQQYYPGITHERIVGHSDIAPERKTDPGPLFDWAHLYRVLTAFDSHV